MAFSDQFAEFAAFAEGVVRSDGEDVTIDDVIDRWWDRRHQVEDLAAIRASVDDYNQGERGVLAREELAEHRAQRQAESQ